MYYKVCLYNKQFRFRLSYFREELQLWPSNNFGLIEFCLRAWESCINWGLSVWNCLLWARLYVIKVWRALEASVCDCVCVCCRCAAKWSKLEREFCNFLSAQWMMKCSATIERDVCLSVCSCEYMCVYLYLCVSLVCSCADSILSPCMKIAKIFDKLHSEPALPSCLTKVTF